MEISVKEKIVADVPLLEFVEQKKAETPMPTVIFYHGWKSRREGVLGHAFELAKKGFRVVCPDAYEHGERHDARTKRDLNTYYQVVQHNLMEFKPLVQAYRDQHLTDDSVGVAGVSMGAVTASMLFCYYDWIYAGVLLEGAPAPRTFTKEIYEKLIAYYEETHDTTAAAQLQATYEEVHQNLNHYDLMENPQRLANRPLLIWHGKDDPVADVRYDNEFFKKAKIYDEGKYVHAVFSEKSDHRVPYHISYLTAAFFDQTIASRPIPGRWAAVQQAMAEKFGEHPEERFHYQLDSFE